MTALLCLFVLIGLPLTAWQFCHGLLCCCNGIVIVIIVIIAVIVVIIVIIVIIIVMSIIIVIIWAQGWLHSWLQFCSMWLNYQIILSQFSDHIDCPRS